MTTGDASTITPADLDLVLVCGSSRSGTTMTSRILGTSPQVHTFEELHFFEGMWDPADDRPVDGETTRGWAARLLAIEGGGFRRPWPVERCVDAAAGIVDGLERPTGADVYAAVVGAVARRHGARVACDQTPRNVYLLDTLLRRFPRAHAVVLIRDPRDVLLSQKHRWRRDRRGIGDMSRRDQLRLWASYHPVTTSQLWRSGAAAARAAAGHERVHVVRFEDLVTAPEATVQDLCRAIGVDYDPDMLQVPRRGSSMGSTRAGTTGIDPSAASQWRRGGLSSTEVAISERINGDAAEGFGYARSGRRPRTSGIVAVALSFPLKSVLALVLNAGRVRGLVRALRRRLSR